MNKKNLFFAGLAALALASCSTPKDIAYFQDVTNDEQVQLALLQPIEIKIQPKDKLYILVSSQDPRLNNQFNLPIMSSTVSVGMDNSGSTGYSRGLAGYTVNSKGDIDFPVLGTIHVAGLTREQVAEKIKKELESRDLIKDPVVTVEFMNLTVSVMGEVTRPGRYDITKDKITILDAISQAGDLTIYGLRDKVTVLRNNDGKQEAYTVDLTNAKSLYDSPVYYLQQNDVVYVEPNDYKKRQSSVNGNNVRSTSFWISVGSLLTSVAVLVINSIKK